MSKIAFGNLKANIQTTNFKNDFITNGVRSRGGEFKNGCKL